MRKAINFIDGLFKMHLEVDFQISVKLSSCARLIGIPPGQVLKCRVFLSPMFVALKRFVR